MNTLAMTAFGWLVPGGGALLERRYKRFAVVFFLVVGTFAAGVALRGANLWPSPVEVQGLDGMTILIAKAGAIAKLLAGGPWLLAHWLGYSQTWLAGRLHELGTTLMTLAGLLNLLALANGR